MLYCLVAVALCVVVLLWCIVVLCRISLCCDARLQLWRRLFVAVGVIRMSVDQRFLDMYLLSCNGVSNQNKEYVFSVRNVPLNGVVQKGVEYVGCTRCVGANYLCRHSIPALTYIMEYKGDHKVELRTDYGPTGCLTNGHMYEFCYKLSASKALVINPAKFVSNSGVSGALHPFINHGPDFRSHRKAASSSTHWLAENSSDTSIDLVEANCAAKLLRIPDPAIRINSSSELGGKIVIILHSIKRILPGMQLLYDYWLDIPRSSMCIEDILIWLPAAEPWECFKHRQQSSMVSKTQPDSRLSMWDTYVPSDDDDDDAKDSVSVRVDASTRAESAALQSSLSCSVSYACCSADDDQLAMDNKHGVTISQVHAYAAHFTRKY